MINEKNINSKRIVIFLLAMCAMIAFFSVFFKLVKFNGNPVVDENIYINEHWTIIENGKVYEDEVLDEFAFSAINKGDTVILKNRIPESKNSHVIMTFATYLSTIDVYLEDELIYTLGHDQKEKGDLVPSGKHMFEIPDNSGGKEVEIIIKPNEDNAFSKIEKIEIGTMSSIFNYYMSLNIINILVCIFLILFGIVISVLSIGSLLHDNRYVKLIPIGAYSFLTGMYGLAGIDFWIMCGISLYSNTICEYTTLYLVPTALAFVFLTMVKKESKIWKFVMVTTAMSVIFSISAIVLHHTRIVSFPRSLIVFHALAICLLSFAVYVVIYENKETKGKNTLIVIGFSALCLSGLVDLVKYYIIRYLYLDEKILSYVITAIGSLIFIILLLINYMLNVYKLENERTEKRILAKLAYLDELCQIYNRTKCNEVTQELDKTNSEYAVVLFDLNGLKKTNDTQGHARGDVLIKEFALVLKECFDEVGEVYRIGGDEFVVIIQNELDKVDSALKNLSRIEQMHGELVGLDISASFGVAFSNELDKGTRAFTKVYSLADHRMYEMKKVYHEEKGIPMR